VQGKVRKTPFLYTKQIQQMEPISKDISKRLKIYWQPFLKKELLDKMIEKIAPTYTVAELCKRGLVIPIKKWKIYINNSTNRSINQYVVGALYFEWQPYMFGWLHMYNAYHFTTQIAERYTIYNSTISAKKVIGRSKFIFKKVRPSFFYGSVRKKIDWYRVNLMSPERALIELLRQTANPEFVKVLPGNVSKDKIINMAKKYSSKIVLQRVMNLINAWKNN